MIKQKKTRVSPNNLIVNSYMPEFATKVSFRNTISTIEYGKVSFSKKTLRKLESIIANHQNR